MEDPEAKSIIKRLKKWIKLTPEESQNINTRYMLAAVKREKNLGKNISSLALFGR